MNSQVIKVPNYLIESDVVFSGGRQTPFWLLSNQYGLINPGKNNELIRFGLKTGLSSDKNFDYDYGIDIVARHSNGTQLYIHQAYLRFKFHFANIQVGSVEEKFGNQDSSLSSGGIIWSGNARPMPKITILIPNYVSVPFTNKYLEFKGGISHGWFGDNQFVKGSWLHHKYFYLQFGGELPVHVNYGFHHFVQWGGNSSDPNVGKLPQGFSEFIKVLFAREGGPDAPISDQHNAYGNHLGSRNFGVDLNLAKLRIGAYWQTLIEDSSGRAFKNIKDGLWGIYVHTKSKDRIINGFLYEFLNTKDQSGQYMDYWLLNGIKYNNEVPGGTHFHIGGNDNYFNNSIYRFGWTYKGMIIGTPFISSPELLKGNNKAYEYIQNNKVTGHHIGLEGKYSDLQYKLFFTYYLNYGVNSMPFVTPLRQYSFLVNLQIINRLPWGMSSSVSVGYDHGELYGNNFGIRIHLSKYDLWPKMR